MFFRSELQKATEGYIRYSRRIKRKLKTEDLEDILQRRNSLLNEHRLVGGMDRETLKKACDNRKKLSEDEITAVLDTVSKSIPITLYGGAYVSGLFALSNYEGVFVDAKDVYAIGTTTDFRSSSFHYKAILCVIFTTNPYVPVFPLAFAETRGVLDGLVGKKGNENIEGFLESICPGLLLKPCDTRTLSSQIKCGEFEPSVIPKKEMLHYLNDACHGKGIFELKKIQTELSSPSVAMLKEIGFMTEEEVYKIMHFKNPLARYFWENEIEKRTGCELA